MSNISETIAPPSTVQDSSVLLRELQQTLYEVARFAELENTDTSAFIQKQTEHSMKLIDSWLLTTQSEIGQQQLPLSPYGLGSIMHESAYEVGEFYGVRPTIDVGVNYPAMTHALTLRRALYSAGGFVAQASKEKLMMRSFVDKTSEQLGVGVFSKDFTMSPKELRDSLAVAATHQHMMFASYSEKSGVLIQIAGKLAELAGGSLHIKKINNNKGLAILLPKSQQLSLLTD